MMFDMYCIKKILAGEKTVTRRMITSNRRPAVPGKIHKLKVDRTNKTFGEILILSCITEQIRDITEEEAKKEGFNSAKEYVNYFMDVNDIWMLSDYDWVWRVEFKLL